MENMLRTKLQQIADIGDQQETMSASAKEASYEAAIEARVEERIKEVIANQATVLKKRYRDQALQAVEVLWTPQESGDTLSEDELLADYPRLNIL